jgi:phage/conjugal plasmid C-4 type zinc finger TraR family protein
MESQKQYIKENNQTNPVRHERICKDCGMAIPKKRLVANPSATRCVYCQKDIEKELEILSLVKKSTLEHEFFLWGNQWEE